MKISLTDLRDCGDDEVIAHLASEDEYLRSAAALELVRRRHPQGMAACLATINDAAEFTHSYSTPSVWQLVGFGAAALSPLLSLADDTDGMTRLRASYAIMEITKRLFGYDGREWQPAEYERWAAWWTAISYRYDEDASSRTVALVRMRAACAPWLAATST